MTYRLAESEYTVRNALTWGNCRGHWRMANGRQHAVHLIIAAIESLPIIGQIVSLMELAIVRKCCQRQLPVPVTTKHIESTPRPLTLFDQYANIFERFGNDPLLQKEISSVQMKDLHNKILKAHADSNPALTTTGLELAMSDKEFLIKVEKGVAHIFLKKEIITEEGVAAIVRKVVNITAEGSSYAIHKYGRDAKGKLDVANAATILQHFYEGQEKDHPYVEGRPIAILGDNGYIGPYYPKSDAFNVISNSKTKDYLQRIRWIKELYLGYQALAAKGIIHRDIKPENCLVDDGDHIHISDFGSAWIKGKEFEYSGLVTFAYRHPAYTTYLEGSSNRQRQEEIYEACDQWSLASSAFAMLNNFPPYPCNKRVEVDNPKHLDLFMKKTYFSEHLKNIIKNLVAIDPQKPPSAKEAFQQIASLNESDYHLQAVS